MLDSISQKIGINIHKEKTKIIRINANNKDPKLPGNSPLQDVDAYTYLGKVINKEGALRRMSRQEYRKQEEHLSHLRISGKQKR
jgi:hypothetical protein